MGKKIFEPIEINGMTLKNRLGFPPFLNMPAEEDCSINEQTIRWFEDRAKGGAGLVMTGAVEAGPPPDLEMLKMMGLTRVGLYDDKFIEGFARMAEAVHAHGAKFGVQLEGLGGVMSGRGPSLPPYPGPENQTSDMLKIHYDFEMPVVEITIEQIEEVKQCFADAAARAKQAGCDCVELHCAHGGATLNCSFISPYYNRRTDQYGGSWENRLRLSTEIIQKMRNAVGPDFPILVRIDSDQLLGDKGITIKDTIEHVVPAMEKAGVDCLDVSQGDILRSGEGILIPMYYPRGCFMDYTAQIKQAAKLPVIGVGRIVDLDMAEQLLQEEKADMIFLGRQLTSDPDTPNKYLEGRADEIRKCIGCNVACGPCPINYEIHQEHIPLTPAESSKKILIIGGGIGGMEAARICAMRGHDVTLMEKNTRLGGTVGFLALDPVNAEFGNFTEYLGIQMEKLNVDVKLGKEATEADIEDLNPDAVILATGASLKIPEVAMGKPGVIDHIEALETRAEIGQRVVVWGLMYGAELAISLAMEGKEVTLIGEAGEKTMASHASSARKDWVWRKLSDINYARETPEAQKVDNPVVKLNVKVKGITTEEIEIEDKDGNKSVLPYDTLVISRGRTKNDSLFEKIEGKAAEVYKIGDCAAAGDIQKAVWSANEVARKIGLPSASQPKERRSVMTEATMSPEEFKQLFTGKTDEEILTTVKDNEEALLDGMFDGMKAAFDPSAAAGQSAVIQYAIDSPAGEMNYNLNVADGACELAKGTAENPRVTLAINMPDFLRMMTGELNGMQAFTSGKLKITGDLMFSQNLASWFKDPNA
jgi:2,4-dienoyl-CoA reductase-like NADH-dependent reductase (Old Yellow Enzyme family)/putative sterol carrier protein/thioredoxin reductase